MGTPGLGGLRTCRRWDCHRPATSSDGFAPGSSDLPILVGRWGGSGDTAGATLGLTAEGASHVVFQLADARERIVSALLNPKSSGPPSRYRPRLEGSP